MRLLLVISLLLNGALGALLLRRSADQTEAAFARQPRRPLATPSPVGTRRRSAPASAEGANPATPWSATEAQDAAQFVANLRAVGCPEPTIRDIVTLRLCRQYRDRWVAREAEWAESWDYTRNRNHADWMERQGSLGALRDALDSELESLFGGVAGKLKQDVLGWAWSSDDAPPYLPGEKRARLREINRRFQRLLSEIQEDPFLGSDAESRARRAELERGKRAEVAAALTPAEFEEYFMRESSAAHYVRSSLPAARSEAEFRAMVRVAGEFDMESDRLGAAARYGLVPGDDGDEVQAREAREAAFRDRLKEVLGETRLAERQQEEDLRIAREQELRNRREEQRARAELAALGASVGVGEEEAQRFMGRIKELQPALEERFKALETTLQDDPAKDEKLQQAAQAEMEKLAVETMGEKGRALVRKMAEAEGRGSVGRQ